MRIFIITLLCSAIFFISCNSNEKQEASKSITGKITLSGAFALYPMAVKWKEEFNKIYPDVRIDISAGGAGKGMTDALSGMVTFGMVSREVSAPEVAKGAWFVPVVKDAVVGVVNINNPVINELMAKGMTSETLKKIWITDEIKTWGEAVGQPSKCKIPVVVYTRSDACGAADIWAKFMGKKQEDLIGVGVFGDPGLAQAVQNDKFGIGYNNIGFAYDSKTKKMNAGLIAIPLDINLNGFIDSSEKFYETKDLIVSAIAGNIYPSPPARDLYLVTKGKPTSEAAKVFLNWILTDGQKFVTEAGYIALSQEKIKNSIEKIATAQPK
jgi:phosphate transport system substrate-binding protein